jgi:hypothetical protein
MKSVVKCFYNKIYKRTTWYQWILQHFINFSIFIYFVHLSHWTSSRQHLLAQTKLLLISGYRTTADVKPCQGKYLRRDNHPVAQINHPLAQNNSHQITTLLGPILNIFFYKIMYMLKDIEDVQLTRFFFIDKISDFCAKNNVKWSCNWLACTI